MTLLEQCRTDIQTLSSALIKAKESHPNLQDVLRIGQTAVRNLLSALEYNTKLPQKQQKAEQDILLSEIKKLEEGIQIFMLEKKYDLEWKYLKERETLQRYLPEQMSSDAVVRLIEQTIIDQDLRGYAVETQFQKLPRHIMPVIRGKFSSQRALELMREVVERMKT